MKISADQYENLKKFAILFFDRFYIQRNAPVNGDMRAVLEEMERKSMSAARKGLGLMISDFLEMSTDWNGDVIKKFDDDLQQQSTITLTELRKNHSKRFAQIVKANKIRNEHDYYHVKGMLDSNTSCFSLEEIINLTQLLDNYELTISSR